MATLKPTTPLLTPQQGTAETGITSATKICAKNAHVSPAKATAVAIPPQAQACKGDEGFRQADHLANRA